MATCTRGGPPAGLGSRAVTVAESGRPAASSGATRAAASGASRPTQRPSGNAASTPGRAAVWTAAVDAPSAARRKPSRSPAERSHTPPFALVADLHMPDIDGVELLRRAAERAPDTFRLLYTGEGQASELSRAMVPGLTHAVVPKTEGVRLLPEALEKLRGTPR